MTRGAPCSSMAWLATLGDVRGRNLVTTSLASAESFAHRHSQRLVVKPAQASGGRGVSLVPARARRRLAEAFGQARTLGGGSVVVQTCIPGAEEGEKRIVWVDGGWSGRTAGSARGVRHNLKRGAQPESCTLTEATCTSWRDYPTSCGTGFGWQARCDRRADRRGQHRQPRWLHWSDALAERPGTLAARAISLLARHVPPCPSSCPGRLRMMRSSRTSKSVSSKRRRSSKLALSRKQVQEAIRRKTSLADADIRGLDLRGLNFDGMNLMRANLEADPTGRSFRNSNLAGASLWSANLQDAVLDGATLDDADFDFATLDGATLKGARVRKAIWPGRSLVDTVRQAIRTGQRLRVSDSTSTTDPPRAPPGVCPPALRPMLLALWEWRSGLQTKSWCAASRAATRGPLVCLWSGTRTASTPCVCGGCGTASAEEVAQDVFVAVYRALPRFRGDAKFSTWLFRIAVNHCKNKGSTNSADRSTATSSSRDCSRPTAPSGSSPASPGTDRTVHVSDAEDLPEEDSQSRTRAIGPSSCCATSRGLPTRRLLTFSTFPAVP